ncbi:DUF6160 family protein [Marinobacter lutaoensis]|jgi:hypothetical protein|uniref:DUF6160 domain-containing protein n=1 Tax=Marinobacter lutaoensis TaxID=135739 RepID=A0A1V2DVC0_9GAMM|nr:DUF6160 family protein [Marinobacter lutaoensis]NVD35132.1 hypothetical protein [Marinobacter lutaoensis]ONF44231.1 hypothetical protein BTO32_08080 [Marinobacter lutaoensis]|tara:strand:+ start:817 stop:1614 length:798 start_codon:yes stop_codon:yes gene_type:complete
MKGLKKIALAAAVAAAPFAAHADLKAMDDSAMGNVTGQAGVTIELETQVSIGQFRYTDEGSFVVNDIVLGGSGVAGGPGTNLLDQLKIDIDVLADGDAVIHVGSLDGLPIDWGMTASSMALEGATDSTTLVSNLSGWGNLGQLDITVDTATDTLNMAVAFNVVDMDFDVEFLGVGIQDMAIMGANFFESADPSTDPTALFAVANVNVYKGAGLGASTKTDVLRIDVADISMDMSIGAINIGGASIGSVAMDNLSITNTKLAVYGH